MFLSWLPLVTIIKSFNKRLNYQSKKSKRTWVYIFFISFPVISVYMDFCGFIPGGMKSHSCLEDRNEILPEMSFIPGEWCKHDKAFVLIPE